MSAQLSECQALELSSTEKCHSEATHAGGLFCWFHSKQVYGLYLGYKRRNARLDALDDDAPGYLKSSTIPLANQNFQDLNDGKALQDVHAHLFEKYNLIGRVIDARRLHHKHFYSLKVDYGHQAYLDKLSSQRHTILRALERLDKRIAKLLYEKEQWFAWTRQAQDEEEAHRDKEQKKIKQEAALFKRHWAVVQARLKRKREQEEKKRHDAYLEAAYQERKAMDAAEEDGDEEWDPLEDEDLDKHYQYVDLIKHFLWMEVLDQDQPASQLAPVTTENPEETATVKETSTPAKKPKKRNKKGSSSKAVPNSKSSKTAHGDVSGQRTLLAMQASGPAVTGEEQREPDKSAIETEVDMRKRLTEGVTKDNSKTWGPQVVGTIENPHETFGRTAPMTDEDVDAAIKEVKEIKLLLFCRLVLAHASLLPAALRASNVEEFLQDAETTDSDLRDLCLKVEAPTLQNIRDACADFARGDEVELDPDESIKSEEETEDFGDLAAGERRYQHLHSKDWFSEHILNGHNRVAEYEESKSKKRRNKQKAKRLLTKKKTKITICGKTLWNHASEKAMSRDGWFQFSIIAKDCDLKHAIQLCRNWNEFSDLNLLALWQFFPVSNWASWTPNQMVDHLQKLEFFPYFVDTKAEQYSHCYQVGRRGQTRRQHEVVEARNVIVGHMKRNDPVTRRFLQYLIMRAGEVLLLVRDGKTGRVITAPPQNELWTYRRKAGVGRASKNEWTNVLEVGPQFFDMNDKLREWRFGFEDYYDVYIWDYAPCMNVNILYNAIIAELRNAWRIINTHDIYSHMEPLLRTLTREETTKRTRKIKPGEDVQSIWDLVHSDSSEFILCQLNEDNEVVTTKGDELAKRSYLFYNEGNVLEDAVLFPEEMVPKKRNMPFREMKNSIDRLEAGILQPKMRNWAKMMDIITQDFAKKTLEAQKEEDEAERDQWELPHIWKTGLVELCSQPCSQEMKEMLMRTRVSEIGSLDVREHYEKSHHKEVLERERSIGESWLLNQPVPIDTLDWLGIVVDGHIPNDLNAPWPHAFVVNDIVQAFATMAMFFPDLEVTDFVTKYIQSDQCQSFRDSMVFNPRERGKTQPDRKGRTNYKLRDSKFWDEWNKVWDAKGYFTENFPLEWNIALRPIIAKLYKAGIIVPSYTQNDRQIVLGVATANTEPHRPGKLDLFINFHNPYCQYYSGLPQNYTPPDKWPALLPLAQKFAGKHEGARFALLRLWSAPHFYPLTLGPYNRLLTSFLDGIGRSWEFKFVPKDMLGSESMMHNMTQTTMKSMDKQLRGRVASRGDLILVMAEDSKQLFKYATAVTFALQTWPWVREVDLWKSFINVELDVLEGLDPYWLD
ncbi:unnamed protein product [Clonostachys rosea]|uniref:Mfs allantoate protein n=1 Tax=Bionectria ochroleuca TaxID=29856 RepID=A0ABY6U5E2_BIOOC|nr:unnamed protein product [Clonostachys rosea]